MVTGLCRSKAARDDSCMTSSRARVLVTDFDGTISKNDFYQLVRAQLLPPGVPNYWAEYRAGRITHFEALRGYFAEIRADEATVWKVVSQMQVDPNLAASVARLRQAGWQIVIASAGCRWYIERLLAEAGIAIELHANPGRFESGRGLLMELPRASPFYSPTHGIDKAGIVRHHVAAGSEVAFAGDGYPDAEAARLVTPQLRFARGDLAETLTARGEPFRPFEVWSEVADMLIERQSEFS
jgi:2-hydroxy-3-keto-5-methylthiopentenyl-1-phosphate phosphatase